MYFCLNYISYINYLSFSSWYLDQLGIFAQYGHSAYCRQTLIGGNYGLLQKTGDNVRVNPDFFGAVLFHHLMGDSVRKVTLVEGLDAEKWVHAYGHGYFVFLIICKNFIDVDFIR